MTEKPITKEEYYKKELRKWRGRAEAKDKCMVANCTGIPIFCIQHVESARKEGYDQAIEGLREKTTLSKLEDKARKEGYQQGFYDCKVIEDGNWKKDIENTARKRKEEYGVK